MKIATKSAIYTLKPPFLATNIFYLTFYVFVVNLLRRQIRRKLLSKGYTITTKQILFSVLMFGATTSITPKEILFCKNGEIVRLDDDNKQSRLYIPKEPISKSEIKKILSSNDGKWFTPHESFHKYPTLPQKQCDFCNFNKEQYEKKYRDAMDRDLNSKMAPHLERCKNYPTIYNAGEDCDLWQFRYMYEGLLKGLAYNLHVIRQQKKLCPEYITAKRNKRLKEAIDFACNQ